VSLYSGFAFSCNLSNCRRIQAGILFYKIIGRQYYTAQPVYTLTYTLTYTSIFLFSGEVRLERLLESDGYPLVVLFLD